MVPFAEGAGAFAELCQVSSDLQNSTKVPAPCRTPRVAWDLAQFSKRYPEPVGVVAAKGVLDDCETSQSFNTRLRWIYFRISRCAKGSDWKKTSGSLLYIPIPNQMNVEGQKDNIAEEKTL